MPNARKTRKNRRTDILEATITLVSQHGFSGTSLNMICDKIDIAKTAIYWHFGNRDGLMKAVIDSLTHDFIEQVTSDSFNKGTPQEQQDRMLESMRDLVENKAEVFRVLILASIESGDPDPEMRAAFLHLTNTSVEAIAEGFQKTLGTELEDMDLFGHTIIALLVAAMRQRFMDPEGCDFDRLFANMESVMNLMLVDRLKRLSKRT